MDPVHSNSASRLSLGEAARMLGVHAATLRRWADQGEIPVIRTPGGHRRFAVRDLVTLLDPRRESFRTSDIVHRWADNALVHARGKVSQVGDSAWLAGQSEPARVRARALGQRLIGLAHEFIMLDEGEDDAMILDEAGKIGEAYGRNCRRLEMPLADALDASMFFRDALVESAFQLRGGDSVASDDKLRILRRINVVLTAVHLATVDALNVD